MAKSVLRGSGQTPRSGRDMHASMYMGHAQAYCVGLASAYKENMKWLEERRTSLPRSPTAK